MDALAGAHCREVVEENASIRRERTLDGLAAAAAQGRRGGRPRLWSLP
jgi:DNA invertase Pin-like site-specific DNA recombinase